MSDEGNIPVLTDMIEKGIEIKMSDLGLEEDLQIETDIPLGDEIVVTESVAASEDPLADHPELEQAIRRILSDHLELAWQEIRAEIQHTLKKSP